MIKSILTWTLMVSLFWFEDLYLVIPAFAIFAELYSFYLDG